MWEGVGGVVTDSLKGPHLGPTQARGDLSWAGCVHTELPCLPPPQGGSTAAGICPSFLGQSIGLMPRLSGWFVCVTPVVFFLAVMVAGPLPEGLARSQMTCPALNVDLGGVLLLGAGVQEVTECNEKCPIWTLGP